MALPTTAPAVAASRPPCGTPATSATPSGARLPNSVVPAIRAEKPATASWISSGSACSHDRLRFCARREERSFSTII